MGSLGFRCEYPVYGVRDSGMGRALSMTTLYRVFQEISPYGEISQYSPCGEADSVRGGQRCGIRELATDRQAEGGQLEVLRLTAGLI